MRNRAEAGFTLIELLIVVAIVGILAAIATPGLLRARMAGNEGAVIGSMRAINGAQASYSATCSGYSPSLMELKAAGDFLSPDLTAAATVVKSGYTVAMTKSSLGTVLAAPPFGCTGTVTDYFAHAEPVVLGLTGMRSFATNAQATIYYDSTGAAIADPIVITTALQ